MKHLLLIALLTTFLTACGMVNNDNDNERENDRTEQSDRGDRDERDDDNDRNDRRDDDRDDDDRRVMMTEMTTVEIETKTISLMLV